MERRNMRNAEGQWRATKQPAHRPPTPAEWQGRRPGILGRMLQALGMRTKP